MNIVRTPTTGAPNLVDSLAERLNLTNANPYGCWLLQARVAAAVLACTVACGSDNPPHDASAVKQADAAGSRGSQGSQGSQTEIMDASAAMPADGKKSQPSQPSNTATNTARANAKPAADKPASSATEPATPGNSEPAGAMGKVDNDDAADDAGTAGATATADAGSPTETAGAGGVSGGTTSMGGAGVSGRLSIPMGGFGGEKAFCIQPPSCIPVFTPTVGLDTCCPINGEECGYTVEYPRELDDGTCRPNSAVFLQLPGQEEQRVVTEGRPDQLITPDCETRSLLAFNMPGCCMPDNRCGISTYQIAPILLGLSLVPAPFTDVECVRVETLNAQFRVTPLAGMAQIPPSDGTCDYADLDARLPHPVTAPPP